MHAEILTQDQIRRVHEASLSILERTGVVVPHNGILRRFADFGANVDLPRQIVRIPGTLVMRLLGLAGRKWTIYGRDTSLAAHFGQGARNYNSTAGQAFWVDQLGGQRRYATLSDVVTASRVGDALAGINIVGAMADPAEIPIGYRCVEVMATMLANTTKPITFWFHDRASARYLVEMMTALRGDEQGAQQYPLCFPLLEPISPLRMPFDGIDLLFETARINLPVPIGPMSQMGLSAPSTIAATLAQENAEVLAGICITQLIRQGMPVCYGGICHAFDMATTQLIFSGPEQVIFSVAMTQMGKHYGLPVYVNAGMTDSKRADAQAGMESLGTLLPAAAAGADIFGHLGIAGVDQGASPDMLTLQDECIAYVESAMRTLDFSDEALGLDVIDEVGPGGSFIAHEHTATHFRDELFFPRLLDRNYYQQWQEAGASGMEERCQARARDIMATHQPEPLADDVAHNIAEVLQAAKRDLAAE